MKSRTTTLKMITKDIKDEKIKGISDKEFEGAFATFAPKDNKVSEVYLRYLENYYRKSDRTPVERGLTVEHIIPEVYDLKKWYKGVPLTDEVEANFKDEYVQSIGNKLLLYGDDNSSANNSGYEKKIAVYKNGKRGQKKGTPVGSFALVSDLLKKYPKKFTHEEIRKRAQALAMAAKKIW
jgi:hypothetical protein